MGKARKTQFVYHLEYKGCSLRIRRSLFRLILPFDIGYNKVSNKLSVVEDGVQAMEFLRREGVYADAPRPDIVLLDLNLPKKDGREVLAEIRADTKLRRLPVVVLTTSEADQDILKVYELNANCYITKPVDLDEFIKIVRSIQDFWFTIVKLPPK